MNRARHYHERDIFYRHAHYINRWRFAIHQIARAIAAFRFRRRRFYYWQEREQYRNQMENHRHQNHFPQF